MGLKASLGEGLTQASDAAGHATSPGIRVRAFKAEDVKLHTVLFLRGLNTFSPIITCLGDFLQRTSLMAIASPQKGGPPRQTQDRNQWRAFSGNHLRYWTPLKIL